MASKVDFVHDAVRCGTVIVQDIPFGTYFLYGRQELLAFKANGALAYILNGSSIGIPLTGLIDGYRPINVRIEVTGNVTE